MSAETNDLQHDYCFRPTQEDDYEKLNEAYNTFTGRSRTLKQYLWQWVEAPFEPSESWTIEKKDTHEIVGHHGVMYLPFCRKGSDIAVGKTENTFVLPDHARKLYYPGFEKKALEQMKDKFLYIYTTAAGAGNGAIGMLRRRLGYKQIGRSACYCIYCSSGAVKRTIASQLPILKYVAGVPALVHRVVQATLFFASKPRLGTVKITPIAWECIQDVAAFWEKNKSFYGITPNRTIPYLRWRFADNPFGSFSLLQIDHGAEIIGYAVTKSMPIRVPRTCYQAVMVEDLIVAGASEDNFLNALYGLGKHHGESELVLIITLDQQGNLHRALRRLLGPLLKSHTKVGPELLVWSQEEADTPWYYTNTFSEGTQYERTYSF